ncbi:hypothetical protein RhiLY_00275 [Ceratobasidium sp. AG-Ba]|nr:hypothetical protein RhiLY_00275 [Ceratobasidium sp. AG-Ba]
MLQPSQFPAPLDMSTAQNADILHWLVQAVTHVHNQAVTDTAHFNTELAAAGAAVAGLQTTVNQIVATPPTGGIGSGGQGSSGGTGGQGSTGGTQPTTTPATKI